MLNLKIFIDEIRRNPQIIKDKQQEYEYLIGQDNFEEIELIYESSDERGKKLLMLFVEEKIKFYKRNNRNLNILIKSIDKLQEKYKSTEISALQVQIALFEWPNNYCNFVTDLSLELMNGEIYAYYKMESFIFNIFHSTTITEKRKGELKRALNYIKELYAKYIYNGLENSALAKISLEIILLLTNIIEIDGTILYNFFLYLKNQNNHEFDETLSNIIFELSKTKGEGKLLKIFAGELADYCHPNLNLSIILNNFNISAHDYFYRSLDNYKLIDQTIIFWRKHFSVINFPVLCGFINMYENNDEPNDILNFIVRISSEKNDLAIEYLNNTENLNMRVTEFLLKNIEKSNYERITNQNPYVLSYVMVRNKDKSAARYIPQLKNSHEENKLIMRIVEDFKYSYEEYKTLYEYISAMDLKTKNELLVKCIIFMGEKFPFELSSSTIDSLYFYMRDTIDTEEFNRCAEEFERYFNSTDNLNGVFEIINLLMRRNKIKKEYFEKIYANFSSLNLKNLQSFLEILNNLREFKNFFYEPIFNKLKYELENTQEFELFDKIMQRYITILYHNSEYDILIEFLSIDDFNTTKRVITIIKNQKLANTDRLLLYILNKYNSSFYVDLHPIFINMIYKLIKNGQSIEVLRNFKNQGLDGIISSARIEPEKRTKLLLKEYLSDLKAKKLSELSSMQKIKEQKIFSRLTNDNNSSNSMDLFLN